MSPPKGCVSTRQHCSLFLWCTQPHSSLLQFLSASGMSGHLQFFTLQAKPFFFFYFVLVTRHITLNLQLMGVLPILPLLFPVMWMLLNAFGEARVLAEFSRASPAGLVRCTHTCLRIHASCNNVLIALAGKADYWHEGLCFIYRHTLEV